MKSLFTCLCIIVLGAVALANPNENHDKINTIKKGLVLDTHTIDYNNNKKTEITADQEIVRLYRRKNFLVDKALNFSTKRNNSKLS